MTGVLVHPSLACLAMPVPQWNEFLTRLFLYREGPLFSGPEAGFGWGFRKEKTIPSNIYREGKEPPQCFDSSTGPFRRFPETPGIPY